MATNNALKIMVIGDLHYGPKNLADHKILAARIHETIDRHEAVRGRLDIIACLGDELDDHDPPADVRGACVKFLRSLAARCELLIVLVGNHTRKNNRTSVGPDHTLAELTYDIGNEQCRGIRVIEDPCIVNYKNYRILALPYMDPSQFDPIMEEYCPELKCSAGKSIDFVLAHQEVHGLPVGNGIISECNAKWLVEWPPLITGHIHERHLSRNVFYPGTPMQHSTNESVQKYIYVGEFNSPLADSSLAESPLAESPLAESSHIEKEVHLTPVKNSTNAKDHIIWTVTIPTEAVIGHALSSNSGVSTGNNIACSRGYLQEIVLHGLPTRYKHEISLDQLSAYLRHVREHPLDYFKVIISYHNEIDIVNSNEFSQLKLLKQVKATTVKIESNLTNNAYTVIPRAGVQSVTYEEFLRFSSKGTPEEAILAKIGQWSLNMHNN
jgi:DNA repair exonuclease SbcCD nuclease subunit